MDLVSSSLDGLGKTGGEGPIEVEIGKFKNLTEIFFFLFSDLLLAGL